MFNVKKLLMVLTLMVSGSAFAAQKADENTQPQIARLNKRMKELSNEHNLMDKNLKYSGLAGDHFKAYLGYDIFDCFKKIEKIREEFYYLEMVRDSLISVHIRPLLELVKQL